MFCGRAASKDLAQPFEHVPAEYGFFSEARVENHSVQGCRDRCPVSCQVMVGGIDGTRAEERHDDDLHQEFKCGAGRDADGNTADPAIRPHVADLAPGRPRPADPNEDQNRAQRYEEYVARQDDENREEPEGSEPAQIRGEMIAA